MLQPDHFVGTVAIACGLFVMLAAALNWDWCYRLRIARWIEKRFGRGCARGFYATLGILLIALGIAIALGFGPNRPKPRGPKALALRSTRRMHRLPGYLGVPVRCRPESLKRILVG